MKTLNLLKNYTPPRFTKIVVKTIRFFEIDKEGAKIFLWIAMTSIWSILVITGLLMSGLLFKENKPIALFLFIFSSIVGFLPLLYMKRKTLKRILRELREEIHREKATLKENFFDFISWLITGFIVVFLTSVLGGITYFLINIKSIYKTLNLSGFKYIFKYFGSFGFGVSSIVSIILILALFIVIGIIIVVMMKFIKKGFEIVQEEDRMVVEFLGRFYKIKKPGLRWNIPFIVRVRAVISIWEQVLNLFEEAMKIDFLDGSATPKKVRAFVKIHEPDKPYLMDDKKTVSGNPETGIYRAVYEISDWKVRAVEELEGGARSYFNSLTIDEALPKGRAGYDLLGANRIPKEEKEELQKTLQCWGLELLRITVTDFDLEPDLVKARGEVQRRRRKVEVTEEEVKIEARRTMGLYIEMRSELTGKKIEEVKQEIAASPDLIQEMTLFAQSIITLAMGLEKNAVIDIRTGGGGDLNKSIMNFIGAFLKSRELKSSSDS